MDKTQFFWFIALVSVQLVSSLVARSSPALRRGCALLCVPAVTAQSEVILILFICSFVNTYAIILKVYYESIAVSNCVNKAKGVTENFVFDKLYSKMKYNSITTFTDDISFAKKRLVTPTSVYR